MPIAIHPYTPELVPAVKALNARLGAGGVASEFHFPESSVPEWLPKVDGRRIFQEYFVAVDGDAARGGFIVKHQDFWINNEVRPIAFYRLPLSEGIVNRAYTSVAVVMLRSALARRPVMFALGMGGMHNPLPQMLKALGWSLREVPFFFRVNHAAKFLRNIAPLRQDFRRRFLATVAASSGAGTFAIKCAQRLRSRIVSGVVSEAVNEFGGWADELWQGHAAQYFFSAVRDAVTLNVLYPEEKYIRLKISRGSQVLGWAVALDTQMHGNKYFGDLRLGSIADCFAAPADTTAVIQGATRFLEDRGVDLIISNQAHQAWTDALKTTGYFSGPSNFIFAGSKSLAQLLAPLEVNFGRMHLNRGDGDGPINL
jgi:hypothetical protein